MQSVANTYPKGRWDRRSGMTLVEVLVACALLALVSSGLVACGMVAIRMSHYLRTSTEARGMAKARMEAITSGGRFRLAQSEYDMILPYTNTASLDHPVVLNTRVVWHDADGNVVGAGGSNDYAEVHVDVTYFEPFRRGSKTDTYSGIVR